MNNFLFILKKKPALTKAERRAIQEAQRAAKALAQTTAPSKGKAAVVKSTQEATAVKKSSVNTSLKIPVKSSSPPSETRSAKRATSSSPVKAVRFNDGNVKLFSHLEKPNTNANLFVNNTHIHPSIARLGEQYAKRTIVGSNARCMAFLNAIKMVSFLRFCIYLMYLFNRFIFTPKGNTRLRNTT